YVSYNRGFKSGLFNGIPANPEPIEPEVLDAFEVGLKTELFDRRIRLNVAGFYYDYKNLQVTLYTPVSSILDNGARARAYGGDIDLAASLNSNLSIFAGATLMHSEFRSYDAAAFLVPQPVSAGGGINATLGSAKGNKLPYTPDFTFNVGSSYTAPLAKGEININLNYSYSDKWFAGPDNILAQPSYGLLDAGATYTLPGGNVSLGVWARNLTDEKYYVSLGAQANPGGGAQGAVGAPRTYGVKAGYKF
ncbi:MAG TPA: TonB-dependent receptor, partial [Steroidobacteraceae bacterium]|nr:TonB-dependent receptor [Steroidobacteraceae bacterium]